MSVISWTLSPDAGAYWYWARNLVGAVVAITVLGESFHHIPSSWLPVRLRPETVHHEIALRSWIILVVALALEVPIEMARDAITAQEMSGLQASISQEHNARIPRHLTSQQYSFVLSKLMEFSKQSGKPSSDIGLFPADPESSSIGLQLYDLTSKAKGENRNLDVGQGPTQLPTSFNRCIMPDVVWGILICAQDNSKKSLAYAKVLEITLNDVGLHASLQFAKGRCDSEHVKSELLETDWSCSEVFIVVGQRP